MPVAPDRTPALLVVEDDPGDFGLLRVLLRQAGFSAFGETGTSRWVKTLAEGIAAARDAHYEAVLLDLSLPDSAGMATVQTMCAALPELPIVVMTGHDDRDLDDAALEAGAQDYLVKGQCDADALRRAVRHTALRHQLERSLHAEQQRMAREHAILRTLIDTLPDLIWLKDADGVYLNCNRRFERFFGASEQEIAGKTDHDFVSRELADFFRDHDRRAMEKDAPTVNEEEVSFADDGHRELLETTKMPLRMSDGSLIGILGIGHDITAQRRNETVLGKAQQAAEAANLAKSRFLATMSHEIRTPMNGILGMAQLLLLPELGQQERQDYARTILNSGQTLLRLLNDILDSSKIEAGKLELEPTVCHPGPLLREVQTLYASAAHDKGLDLAACWRGGETAYLIDPHRLRQMLSNLVGNAIKFTAQGRISIEAVETERHGKRALLEFAVSDTGIGIPTEKQDLLFKPFSQADSSTTRQFGGTGLGLSIVKNLAQLMGGDVGIDSVPGQGSRFWFRILAEVTETLERRQGERVAGTPAGATARPALRGRVLIVEDDPTNQKVIRAMLASLGIDCTIAADGQQALDRIDNGAVFDLILMDVQMPVLDGMAATASIRQRERDLGESRRTIVALTADAFAEDRERCLRAGMDDFLPKPIDIKMLTALLRRWLPPPAAPGATRGDPSAAVAVPPAPTFATFDDAALLNPLGGNRELARLVIDSAQNDLPKYFALLEVACQAADWKTAERLAHTLKGLAAQLGGLKLSQLMREADDRLKAGEPLDAASLAELQAEYAALAAALRAWQG